jgi:hypothetical protein
MTQPDLLSPPPAANAATSATILLGLDDKDKRHASFFTADQAAEAALAATKMGMATLPVTDGELSALATKLPQGKIFGSGKAFVPFVGEALFEKLAAHLPDRSILPSLRAAANAAEAVSDPAAKVYNQPKDWDVIAVGDLVLASDGPGEGWWEAVVQAVTGELFTLLWRDWPDEFPKFVRTRDQIGLLPQPKSKAN